LGLRVSQYLHLSPSFLSFFYFSNQRLEEIQSRGDPMGVSRCVQASTTLSKQLVKPIEKGRSKPDIKSEWG